MWIINCRLFTKVLKVNSYPQNQILWRVWTLRVWLDRLVELNKTGVNPFQLEMHLKGFCRSNMSKGCGMSCVDSDIN